MRYHCSVRLNVHFLVGIFLDLPLTEPIPQRFDIGEAAVVAAYRKSHILPIVYLQLLKKGQKAQCQQFIFG